MDNQLARERRPVDLEILAALKRPDMFQRLVDGVYTLSDKTQSEVRHELEQTLPVHNSGRPVERR